MLLLHLSWPECHIGLVLWQDPFASHSHALSSCSHHQNVLTKAISWALEEAWLCLERSGRIMSWMMLPGLCLEVGWARGVLRIPWWSGPRTSVGHSALPCWEESVNTEAFHGHQPYNHLVKIIFKNQKCISESPSWFSPFSKGKSSFTVCFRIERCSVDRSLSLSLASQSNVSFSREFFHWSSQTETHSMVPSKANFILSPWLFVTETVAAELLRQGVKTNVLGTERAGEALTMLLHLQNM